MPRHITGKKLDIWDNSLYYRTVFCQRDGPFLSSIAATGGEAGNLHPGLWKIPPRLLENPTFLDKQVSEEKLKK